MTTHDNDGGSRRQLNEDQNTVSVVLYRNRANGDRFTWKYAAHGIDLVQGPHEYSWNLASRT